MSAVLGLMGHKKTANERGIWHKVLCNTTVRKTYRMESERVTVIQLGTKVFVVDQKDRRVRIEHPVHGWCSVRSSNHDLILAPLEDLGSNFKSQRTLIKHQEEKVESLNSEMQSLKEKRDDILDSLVDEKNEIEQITRELDKINNEINQKTLSEYEEKPAKDVELSNEDLHKLQKRVTELQEELHTKSTNEELSKLQQNIQTIQEQKLFALEQLNHSKILAENAQKQAEDVKKKVQDIFGSVLENSNEKGNPPKLQNGDVVLLGDRMGLAVVRYFGKVDFDKEPQIGVQLSDPIGDCNGTREGKTYFSCNENCGLFVPWTSIQKRISPKELLLKLHKVTAQTQKMGSAKE